MWYFRDVPAEHPGISPADLDILPNKGMRSTVVRPRVPWGALFKRMAPVTIVYFCYGWTLWLYLTWLPSYFLHEYKYDLRKSALFTSAVFFAGVVGDYLGGEVSDRILHRTGDLQKARRNVIVFGFLGSFVCMVPIFLTHDLVAIILALGAAFFCAEIVIGPMWSIPMDIAGKFSGTAAGMMNTGSALAAILSPIAFGYIIDASGNWQLPFAGSLGFLLLGALLAPTMHPEQPFGDDTRIG
jgi:MFS family permease